MDEFMKMDIFFFVTTVVVVVLGACAAYVLWRLARVLRYVEHITEQVAAESDEIRHDLAEMRRDIHRGRGRILSLFDFFGKTVERKEKGD
jgi:hypothetical protein